MVIITINSIHGQMRRFIGDGREKGQSARETEREDGEKETILAAIKPAQMSADLFVLQYAHFDCD